MKKLISLFRTTIVGGIMFLAPFTILLIILGKVHNLALALVVPLTKRINFHHMMGLKAPWILRHAPSPRGLFCGWNTCQNSFSTKGNELDRDNNNVQSSRLFSNEKC